jgi:hypothetical protein
LRVTRHFKIESKRNGEAFSISLSFMVCDLRSYAGADDTPLRLENLGADQVTWSGHSEALCKGRTAMCLKLASDRDNPDSPRPISSGAAGAFSLGRLHLHVQRPAVQSAGDREQRLTARGRGILSGAAGIPSGVEAEWSGVLRTVRAGMLAVPSRCTARLPHLTAHDVGEIDGEVRGVLSEIGTS